MSLVFFLVFVGPWLGLAAFSYLGMKKTQPL